MQAPSNNSSCLPLDDTLEESADLEPPLKLSCSTTNINHCMMPPPNYHHPSSPHNHHHHNCPNPHHHHQQQPCTPDLSSSSSVYSTPSVSRRSSTSGCSKSVRFAPALAASVHYTHSPETYDRTPIVPAPATESLVLPPHCKSDPDLRDSWVCCSSTTSSAAAVAKATSAKATSNSFSSSSDPYPFSYSNISTPLAYNKADPLQYPSTNSSWSSNEDNLNYPQNHHHQSSFDMMLDMSMHQDDADFYNDNQNNDDYQDDPYHRSSSTSLPSRSQRLCGMGKFSRGELYGTCDAFGGF